MNVRKNLIALAIAATITTAQFTGLALLAGNATQVARRIAAPNAAIPVLPTIQVRPTRADIRAAFADTEVASNAHPDYAMPFYSFAAKPTAANKG